MTSWLRQYCFHVTDIERSIKFYEAIGLTCTSRTQITPEIKRLAMPQANMSESISAPRAAPKPKSEQ